MHFIFTLIILLSFSELSAQYKVHGIVTNNKLEPLAFASVEVKQVRTGTITKEDGSYELELDEGKYDLIISMIGYQTEEVAILVTKSGCHKNIILEVSKSKDLSAVVVKSKDRAEEIIRNVIRHKDDILSAPGPYSCKVYIRALQEDSSETVNKRLKPGNKGRSNDNEFKKMNMTEI
ncbi:MAG TPA: carboxypeptidase-like regulatory domain-containing protein, partial [Chitinophagaceae bacterium]|nr:carboxypeptidase-like regulatory domain-containing protein [Chitinophagaceae bacterium]